LSNSTNPAEPAQSNNLSQIAVEQGRAGCSCSEAILSVFGPLLGLPSETAMKLASGFGGGMGLMGETCGAVTASFMALGLALGTHDVTDTYSRQNTYVMIGEFADRFKGKLGSLNCRELCVGHTMATPEGAKALRASGRPEQIIRIASEILDQILNEARAI
jgi:C_GCAxxG_C_C family probable redox protein